MTTVKVKADKSASFEAAMKRLETIVVAMERGDLNLEDLIAQFEEGQKLIALCNARLTEVERKVELLVKKGETLATQPFDEGEEAAGVAEPMPSDDELFDLKT